MSDILDESLTDSESVSLTDTDQEASSIDYTDLLTSIDTKLDTLSTLSTSDDLSVFSDHLDNVFTNVVYLCLVLFFFTAVRLLITSIRKGES